MYCGSCDQYSSRTSVTLKNARSYWPYRRVRRVSFRRNRNGPPPCTESLQSALNLGPVKFHELPASGHAGSSGPRLRGGIVFWNVSFHYSVSVGSRCRGPPGTNSLTVSTPMLRRATAPWTSRTRRSGRCRLYEGSSPATLRDGCSSRTTYARTTTTSAPTYVTGFGLGATEVQA